MLQDVQLRTEQCQNFEVLDKTKAVYKNEKLYTN